MQTGGCHWCHLVLYLVLVNLVVTLWQQGRFVYLSNSITIIFFCKPPITTIIYVKNESSVSRPTSFRLSLSCQLVLGEGFICQSTPKGGVPSHPVTDLCQYPDIGPGGQQWGEDDDALQWLHLAVSHHQFSSGGRVKTQTDKRRQLTRDLLAAKKGLSYAIKT